MQSWQRLRLFELMGLSENESAYEMVCDRLIQGGFGDSLLVLTKQELLVARSPAIPLHGKIFRGFPQVLGKRKEASASISSAHPKEQELQELASWTIERFSLDELESIRIIHLVASGLLVVKGKEERIIAAFTNGLMKQASELTKAFDHVKKGETAADAEPAQEEEEFCPECGMMYPERDRRICPKCMKRSAIFFRLLKFAVPYKRTVALVILFMLLNAACSLAIPYFMGTVLFDQALGGTGYFAGKIGLVIGLIVLFRTLSLLFGVVFGILNATMAANVVFDLKSAVFSSMQRLSLSFFQRKQTGHLMTRINNDSSELQNFFVDGLSYFVINALNIIGITVVLLILDWQLTLLCFLPLPAVIWLVRKAFPKLWRMSWRRHKRASAMNSLISDSIRGTRVVKAFGMENKERDRFQQANQSFADTEQRFNQFGGTIFPSLKVLTQLGGMLVWAFGGWMIMRGEIAFGMVLSFVQYLYMLYGPIEFMNNIVGWWSHCMAASQRIFEIQDAVPEIADKPDATILKTMTGSIELRNVTFGYEPNKPILKDISLKVQPGMMLGVVGQSGAGKSTLVNVISRLYEVNEGSVLVDGIDVRDLSSPSLRSHIGIVSQDIYVFTGSIAENIAYASPDCSTEELICAARIAGAHDFIEKLPEGYDTIVGTGGYNLSGGEKQRLSIARAVLHNPQLLILDEATASLDTETELKIQEALETLIRGRTTIAIAHRLSTLRNADYLVIMEEGRIVEEGGHTELMQKEGAYAKLVKKHDEALKMNEVIAV